MLEGVGRLFKRAAPHSIHPAQDPAPGRIETADDAVLPRARQQLHRLLRALGRIELVHPAKEAWLSIEEDHVLSLIEQDDRSRESMVSAIIECRKHFTHDLARTHA